MSALLLEMYRQAAEVIGTLINRHKFPFKRTVAMHQHRWYASLDPYDALEAHFEHAEISHADVEWLRERALSRNEFILFSDYTPLDLFLNDVLDILEYYNHKWEWNPPKGYIVPETFYL
jgi:radical SAM superfamily enzyme